MASRNQKLEIKKQKTVSRGEKISTLAQTAMMRGITPLSPTEGRGGGALGDCCAAHAHGGVLGGIPTTANGAYFQPLLFREKL